MDNIFGKDAMLVKKGRIVEKDLWQRVQAYMNDIPADERRHASSATIYLLIRLILRVHVAHFTRNRQIASDSINVWEAWVPQVKVLKQMICKMIDVNHRLFFNALVKQEGGPEGWRRR